MDEDPNRNPGVQDVAPEGGHSAQSSGSQSSSSSSSSEDEEGYASPPPNKRAKRRSRQEMFVTDLAKRSFKNCKNNFLEYKHIANIVQQDDTLDFLREIMPRKITVRQYKELMARKAAKGNDSEDSSEESSEEGSSDDSSSSSNQDPEQPEKNELN